MCLYSRDEYTRETIRHEAGTVEENPLRLETAKAEQIVNALSAALANAYVLCHQVHKHH